MFSRGLPYKYTWLGVIFCVTYAYVVQKSSHFLHLFCIHISSHVLWKVQPPGWGFVEIVCIRCVGGIYLFPYSDPTSNWFVVNIKLNNTNTIKSTCLKRDWTTFQISVPTPLSILNTVGKTYVFSSKFNNHALRKTIIKPREIHFPNGMMSMHHREVANTTQFFGCVNFINRSWRTWTTEPNTQT